jgi:hypothetical protein
MQEGEGSRPRNSGLLLKLKDVLDDGHPTDQDPHIYALLHSSSLFQSMLSTLSSNPIPPPDNPNSPDPCYCFFQDFPTIYRALLGEEFTLSFKIIDKQGTFAKCFAGEICRLSAVYSIPVSSDQHPSDYTEECPLNGCLVAPLDQEGRVVFRDVSFDKLTNMRKGRAFLMVVCEECREIRALLMRGVEVLTAIPQRKQRRHGQRRERGSVLV